MTEHEKIQKLAYALWDGSQRPENRALDFWLAAERAIKSPPLKAFPVELPGEPKDQWPGDNGEINIVIMYAQSQKREALPCLVSFKTPLGDRLVVAGSHYNSVFPSLWKTSKEGKWRNVRNASVREKMGFLEDFNVKLREARRKAQQVDPNDQPEE